MVTQSINKVQMQRNSNINIDEVKITHRFARVCPTCKRKIKIGIEQSYKNSINRFPYPHIVLHGNPLHALIVYLDSDFKVRGFEHAESIEIERNSETFNQLLKKWSNPF